MITKNYKSIFSYAAALAIGLFVASCEQEDNTGWSTFSPTSPAITITTEVTDVTLVENDQEYTFTVTLSEAQLVDVKVYPIQVGGDATVGDDYTISGSLVISAGSLSSTGKIKILKDDLIEPTETVKIQIGNEKTANAAITPATMNFTILNYTEGDLVLDMSWAMSEKTTDSSGEVIKPTDFADLVLTISSTPDLDGAIDSADGAGFETIVLSGDEPNGDYYVVSSFWSANTDIDRDLDLNLELNQSGIINGDSYEFSGALNSMISCEEIYYVMGKITKVGTSYTFENIAEKSEVTAAPFIGTATVVIDDWADDYIDDEIIIEAGSTPYEFYIRMTTNPYINNPDTAYLIMTIDPTTGTVTGESNEPWDYDNSTPVTAAGSVDLCNKIIDIELDYWYGEGTHYKGQQLKLQL